MNDLTLEELFGSNVSYDDSKKQITFDLNDLQDLDADSITEVNCHKCAGRIFWAILSHLFQVQPDTNNNPDRGIYLVNQGKRTVTRGGVTQFGFQMVITGYTPDPLGDTLSSKDLVMKETSN